MTVLLDANVLIALVDPDHVHHDPAANWLGGRAEPFATCPITQGAMARYLLRQGHPAAAVAAALARIQTLPRHRFWSADLPLTGDMLAGVIGHRQVTDSYLCHLAAAHEGVVATYDRGLFAAHPTRSVLVPTT